MNQKIIPASGGITMFNPDMYETPYEVAYFMANRYLRINKQILEPSAGSGAIACLFNTPTTDCIELDTERYLLGKEKTNYATWHNCNFFDFEPQPQKKYDLVVGNPPYGDAVNNDRFRFTPINFIKKCAEMLADDGLIVFLLESDYFRSINRHEYFKESGVFLRKKIDIIGRLKFLQNGKSEGSASRYHSIFEFSKMQPDHPILETVKL